MNFRSITDLTELESLPDDAKILVIDGGTAKQISKTNAKFGGGGGNTIFYTTDATTLYTDSGCTVAATAQEVFDACMNGVALITIDGYADMLVLMQWQDADGGATDMTNVAGIVAGLITDGGKVTLGTLASSSGGGK